jgi:hypothetical protein
MSGSEELINHNERSRAGVPPDWFLHHGYFEAAQSAHRRLQQHLGVMIPREWSVDHLLAFIDTETEGSAYRPLVKLRRFTRQLDVQHWDDTILGAINTSLFWAWWTFELLLAAKWDTPTHYPWAHRLR